MTYTLSQGARKGQFDLYISPIISRPGALKSTVYT
jgi:hypothetical protein